MPFSISSMKYSEAGSGPNSAARIARNRSVPSEALRAETLRPSFSTNLRSKSTRRVLIERKSSTSMGVSLRTHSRRTCFLEASAQCGKDTDERFSP